ncbi:hypothetical protein [Micromonospora sp. NPDC023633]
MSTAEVMIWVALTDLTIDTSKVPADMAAALVSENVQRSEAAKA